MRIRKAISMDKENQNTETTINRGDDSDEPPLDEPPLCGSWLFRVVFGNPKNESGCRQRDNSVMHTRLCGKFSGFVRII